MTGEPITTTLLVASAATTGAGLLASQQQEKTELAFLDAQTERAKLAATDQALNESKTFRRALASQLALSSLRSGAGGSLVRQFGAESVSNFLKDQDVLNRRKEFIDVAAQSERSQIKSNRFNRDISAIGNLVKSGLNTVNFSG